MYIHKPLIHADTCVDYSPTYLHRYVICIIILMYVLLNFDAQVSIYLLIWKFLSLKADLRLGKLDNPSYENYNYQWISKGCVI